MKTSWILALALVAPALRATPQPEPLEPVRLIVAVNGSPDASGSAEDPVTFEQAMARAQLLARNGQPVDISVSPGRYRFLAPFQLIGLRGSTTSVLLRIRGMSADGEVNVEAPSVVFDGSLPIDPGRFEPVLDEEEIARLAPGASGQIVAQTITDPRLLEALNRKIVLPLLVNGRSHLPSRFPNEGYATLRSEAVRAEISPPAVPVGKQNYGVRAGHAPFQEPGRRAGWLGSRDEPRGAWARIGERADEQAGTWQQWQAELSADNSRNVLTGFLDANWLQKSQQIVAADPETESFHLSQALAYGWGWRKKDKTFFIHGLLCELDAPGEWHFDPETQRLFLYPPEPLDENSRIDLPVAPGFMTMKSCSWVRLENFAVEHVASGTVLDVENGRNNVLAGLSIRRSSALGVRLEGTANTLRSSDLFDLAGHVRLTGGERGPGRIESGGNLVENCHIFQRAFRDQRITVGISGVGNLFRHNLVHDSLGQAVTVGGNDHLLESNELFNIGFDEGDGGAIYSGGDLTGYGITYRHNFIHHLMHRPGKVERSGIHLDDLQAGATCEGNVFFKSAAKGIFMNGGAGHRLLGNVFIEGYRGIYNVGSGAARNFQRQEAISADPDHNYRGKKEDYVGNAERRIGEQGWNEEPWLTRYPRFALVMNDVGEFGRFWPIRCEVRNNVFCRNRRGPGTIWSRVAPEAREKSVVEGDIQVQPDVFRNPDTLDFGFAVDRADLPQIPFETIGLFTDSYRTTRPDPDSYRRAVRAFYGSTSSMPGTDRIMDSTLFVDRAPRRVR